MENKYRDPESKNKTKTLKADAQKQIERNKIILKDIIRRYPIAHAVPSRDDPLTRRMGSRRARGTSKAGPSTTATSTTATMPPSATDRMPTRPRMSRC